MYGSVHYLDIIAPRFNDELLKKLLDIDDNLTITMHMQTMDPVKAIKMLKGALTNIQKMKIEEQKELAERLSKLNRFLEKNWMSVRSDPDTSNVGYETYRYFQLLKRQREAMADYNQILLARIGYAVQQGIED